jgi:hypothetical protein
MILVLVIFVVSSVYLLKDTFNIKPQDLKEKFATKKEVNF